MMKEKKYIKNTEMQNHLLPQATQTTPLGAYPSISESGDLGVLTSVSMNATSEP